MAKTMLIDATHPEETRVAVADGRKLEEFDVEIAGRRPLKGNIYLAKVTRVEPSLQAAFVEYGGNRHGFLAFSEIHPDYYRIPVADREALLRQAREDEEDDEPGEAARGGTQSPSVDVSLTDDPNGAVTSDRFEAERDSWADSSEPEGVTQPVAEILDQPPEEAQPGIQATDVASDDQSAGGQPENSENMVAPWEGEPGAIALNTPRIELRGERIAPTSDEQPEEFVGSGSLVGAGLEPISAESPGNGGIAFVGDTDLPSPTQADVVEVAVPEEVVEMVGGEEPAREDDPELDEERARRRRQRNLRRYKIQEVIKRRQILLVQVTKEERGNKGAALTTYLSLAGRYCVLMPNTDRGGGISRRITNASDRKRLKSIIDDLDAPDGMAVIVRTAGMERGKPEIRRDFEYLLRLWDEIRETTLQSSAPALIYEEASLIKRSIRDLYTKDIGDIVISGPEAYGAARAFMRTLAPGHLKRIQLYRDPSVPLFQRHQIEGQIAAIHEPVVQLRSGGYIVINQTEALVAIDVNSGRSTRERNIEETALRTNLEAAEEIARQLRLRDLAGLIVIDFIDMEENRNNNSVERRLKDALKNDRARIQIGRISTFGLLEMSRQRLHPSLVEASTELCANCAGAGRVRSVDSTSLQVLRMVEEEITRQHSPGITVTVPPAVALYVLNQKRAALADVETRRGVRIYLQADEALIPPDYRVERIKLLGPGEEVIARPPAPPSMEESVEDEEAIAAAEAEEAEAEAEIDSETEAESEAPATDARSADGRPGRKRRRRRGRGGRFRADEFTESEAREGAGERQEAPIAAQPGPAEEAKPDSDGEQDRQDRPGDGPGHGPGDVPGEGPGDDAQGGGPGDGPTESQAGGAEADREGESQEQRRRRRRGRRGGRRRQRRPQDGEAPEKLEAARQTPEEGVPGLGDQPRLPDELPPDWRPSGNGAPIDETPAAEPSPVSIEEAVIGDHAMANAAEAPRPRRPRRPRRREDEGGASPRPAPSMPESEIAAAPAVAADIEPPVGQTASERPVRLIEIGDRGEPEPAREPETSDRQDKKRGWWRRLME